MPRQEKTLYALISSWQSPRLQNEKLALCNQIWRNSHQWYLIGQTVTKSYQIPKYRISNVTFFCVREDRLINQGHFLFSWRKWKPVFLIQIAKVKQKYPIDQIMVSNIIWHHYCVLEDTGSWNQYLLIFWKEMNLVVNKSSFPYSWR